MRIRGWGATAVIVLLSSSGLSAVAAAKLERFTVVYGGTGTYIGRLKSLTSPECGEVTEVRNETTHVSWETRYDLGLLTEGSVFSPTFEKSRAVSLPRAANDSHVTLSDTGCQTGIADCHGQSQPQPGYDAVLDVAAFRRGVTRVTAAAVGGFIGFTGRAFSGGWGFPSGSCATDFNNRELLVGRYGVPGALKAGFPVKAATLRRLPVGHYFQVRIRAGHYAPADHHVCQASTGCLRDDFTWQGTVRFTRDS